MPIGMDTKQYAMPKPHGTIKILGTRFKEEKVKTYTVKEIYAQVDKLIHLEETRKNEYIRKNSFRFPDVINRFDQRIAAFTELYSVFEDKED